MSILAGGPVAIAAGQATLEDGAPLEGDAAILAWAIRTHGEDGIAEEIAGCGFSRHVGFLSFLRRRTPAEIEASLTQFIGRGDQFQHWMSKRFRYTEGVKFLADAAGAHWLIDLCFSWQTRAKVAREPFQVWTLELTGKKNPMARAACDDGNGNKLAAQLIPYTDFPLKSIKLYLCGGVLMLPIEY